MSHKAEHRNQSRRHRKNARQIAAAMATPTASKPPQLEDGDTTPQLLQRLADALNAVNSRGIDVQFASGAVVTEYGYIFDFGSSPANGGEPWQVRTRMLTEFSDASLHDEREF
jgi:hypothetical protein